MEWSVQRVAGFALMLLIWAVFAFIFTRRVLIAVIASISLSVVAWFEWKFLPSGWARAWALATLAAYCTVFVVYDKFWRRSGPSELQ
jgi:uncharacterized MnhB-related membrane protein